MGGLFPQVEPDAELTVEELDGRERVTSNHPSFEATFDSNTPPGVELMMGYVKAGFGRLFGSAAEASACVGREVHPAPMGTVSKIKEDGSWKHRPIQDLRRNSVNAAVRLPERQVLPRPIDHALDLVNLNAARKEGESLMVLVLDFKDAFMSIPLHEAEQPFNCTKLAQVIPRGRDALDADEPDKGSFIVWRVLGFGGKPNPLVYSRAASFAMRTGQALFHQSLSRSSVVARAQLYVDDPAVVIKGPRCDAVQGLDLLLMWWLALGIPLSWAKGALYEGAATHDWIGVRFTPREDGCVVMELPTKFLSEFVAQLEPFCRTDGGVPLREAEQLVGRAGRVAYVVPAARPFVSGLYAALSAAKRDIRMGKSKTLGRLVPSRRFACSACWLRALVLGGDRALFPLQRRVVSGGPLPAVASGWVAQFDASTTGGGAILRSGGRIAEYFSIRWSTEAVKVLGVHVADSKYQSFWEFLMVLLVLLVWGARFTDKELAIVGG